MYIYPSAPDCVDTVRSPVAWNGVYISGDTERCGDVPASRHSDYIQYICVYTMSTQFAVLTCRTVIHQVALIFSSFFTSLLPFLPLPQHQFPVVVRLRPVDVVVSDSPSTTRCDADFAPSTPVPPCMTDFAPPLVVAVAAFTLEYSYKPTVRADLCTAQCRSALNGTAHDAIRRVE